MLSFEFEFHFWFFRECTLGEERPPSGRIRKLELFAEVTGRRRGKRENRKVNTRRHLGIERTAESQEKMADNWTTTARAEPHFFGSHPRVQ